MPYAVFTLFYLLQAFVQHNASPSGYDERFYHGFAFFIISSFYIYDYCVFMRNVHIHMSIKVLRHGIAFDATIIT